MHFTFSEPYLFWNNTKVLKKCHFGVGKGRPYIGGVSVVGVFGTSSLAISTLSWNFPMNMAGKHTIPTRQRKYIERNTIEQCKRIFLTKVIELNHTCLE